MKQTSALRALFGLTALNLCLLLPPVQAANKTWSGAGADANWTTGNNWGGTQPANNDNLIFNGTTQQNNTNNISSLVVGYVTFNNGGFVLNGNSFSNFGTAPVFFTNSAGTNIIACPLVTGPTPGAKYWFIAPNSELRLTGVVTNTAASGTSVGWLNLTNGGTVRIMNSAKSTRGMDLFQGTVIVDGSSALVDGNNDGIRFKPPTGSTAAVQITNNGYLRIGGGGNIRMGNSGTGIGGIAGAGSLSRVDISSGTFEIYGSATTIYIPDNVASLSATFNQNGGLVWGSGGSGNTVTFGNAAGPTGIYNLNGGTLWIAQIKQVNSGANVFSFNGGVLKPTGSSSTFMQGVDAANVQSGGAVIDTTNFNITIAQNLQAGSPGGGLTKLGTGTLALTGSSSYTGSTTISNGTLAITTGSLTGGGAMLVADGASLSITNAGGSMTVSSLSLGATLTNTLQFSFPSGNPGSGSIVAGTLTANGYVTVNITGSGLTTGTFDLVGFTTGLGVANFHLSSVPPGVSANLVSTPTSMRLNISSVVKSLQWSSAPADSEWNTSSINWLDLGNGSNPTNYVQSGGFGDMVTFSSSGTTAIDVPITVTPVSVTVDGSAPDYSFTGAGKISGVGSLTMNSFQHLTVGMPNDYSGGTIVNAGTIYAGANQALGVGPVTLNINGTLASDSTTGRTLSNSVVQTSDTGIYFGDSTRTGTLTLAGNLDLAGGTTRTLSFLSDVVISGSLTNGTFTTKTGPGAMILKGYSVQNALQSQQQGDLIVDGGKFICGNGWRLQNTLPGSTLHLIVTNGGVLNVAAFVNTGNLRLGLSGGDNSANNILDIVSGIVDLTPTNGVVSGNAVNVGGSGANDIVYLRSGGLLVTRELYGSAPSGTSDAHFMGGTMRAIANDIGFIQGLTNAFMEDGGLTIDTTNFSVTVPQALLASGAGGLTKVGTGTLTLTGSNTYTGPTVVNAGKLVLGPAHASRGNATVNANSTLAFLQSAPPATVNLPSVTIGSGTNSMLEAQLSVTNAPAATITNLILNGSVAVNVSGSFGVGEIPLFGYGTITGAGGLTLGAVPLGTVAHLVTNAPNKTIDLVVSSIAALTWTGTNNGNWDTTTTNWTVLGSPAAFAQLANVLFNDTASNSSVNLATALNPSTMVVSNSTLSYAFSGSGSLGGNMTLVKDGTNSVTLNTANTFTGTTTVKSGTMIAGNATALGSSTANVNVQNGATLDVNGNNLGLQPIAVGGSGVGGNGAIINSGAAQNDALRNVTLTGDTVLGGAGSIGLRTTANTDPGLIANGYKLTKVGSSQINLNGGTTVAGITTTWFLDIGNVDIKQGILSFQRHAGLGNPTNTVTIESGATLLLFSLTPTNPVPPNAIVMTNAILQGTGGTAGDTNTIGGQITLNGPTNAINTTASTFLALNGPIVGTGGVVFSGTNILGGTNTYAGSTVISNGLLTLASGALLAGSPSITTTTNGTLDLSSVSPWTLGAGQTLGGAGTVNGSVLVNGTLAPGKDTGTLTINGDLTLAGNVLVAVNKALVQSNDMATVSGSLSNSGSGSVVVTNLGPMLVIGDKFTLFSQPVANGGALNVTGGYATWSNSLAADGSISVFTVINPVNTNSARITYSYASGNLNLGWPTDHIGWRLQVQTNALATGLNTNWFTWPGSSSTNAVTVPVSAGNPTVFFRLVYP